MGPRHPGHTLGIDPFLTASGPLHTAEATPPSTAFSGCGASLVLCRLSCCVSGDSEILLALVCCFCGFPHLDLHPFADIIPPLSLWLVSRSLVQLLIVDLCICFHQFLDEASMIIEGVLNLMAREVSSGPFSPIAWHLIWGRPYGFGQILSARFLDHPIIFHTLSKYFFPCSLSLIFPQADHPISSCPPHSPSLVCSPFPPPPCSKSFFSHHLIKK